MTVCSLCKSQDCEIFHTHTTGQVYHSCPNCGLVFLDAEFHLAKKEENERYRTHENSLENQGYKAMLLKLVDAMVPYLTSGAVGVDFGAGPVAAMETLFRERGFRVATFDPLFFPDASVLQKKYDFLIASEVVEHFRIPAESWSKIKSLVSQQGLIGVATSLLDDSVDFSNWHYRRDPTHVAFYRPVTMEWISARFGWQILHRVGKVTVFKSSL